MADFCKACSIEYDGEDHGDLAGITREKHEKEGLAAVVICEGCGIIQVNHAGECVSPDCLKVGQSGHGVPFNWRGGEKGTRGKGKLVIKSKHQH